MPQPSENEKTTKAKIIAALVVLIAFLSALGTGFQNATAIIQLLVQGTTLALNHAWVIGILSGVAGGICSTLVNFFLNVELLEDFGRDLEGRNPHLIYPALPKNYSMA